jgi:DNA-binding CsgD family transcriptional regulator
MIETVGVASRTPTGPRDGPGFGVPGSHLAIIAHRLEGRLFRVGTLLERLQEELDRTRCDLEALTAAPSHSEAQPPPSQRPRPVVAAASSDGGEMVLADLPSAVATERLRAAGLTVRESQVALALAAGVPSRQSAAQLGIGVPTLHKHRERVYTKLGVHTRVAACVAIVRLVGG